ncbi:MAG: ABC transporter substrate-binding protein, partial [Pseudorhodoplanes sp.]
KTWIFNLRKGVEFHNGKTFTSEDAIFSLNHHREASRASLAAGFVRQIADLKADGPNRMVVTLAGPNADFPVVLSEYRLMVMSSDTKDFATNTNGTGGYVVKTWEPGVKAHAVKNKNYFRKDRAFVDEIESILINDTSARQSALLSGRVDVINRVDLKTVAALKNAPNVIVRDDASFRHMTMPMQIDVSPYNNLDLRKALQYVYPRQEVVDKILNGSGRVGNDHPITPNHRYFNKDLPQIQFDLDKAKFHFQKAGVSNAVIDLNASEASFEGAIDASVLFQAAAAKAGINVKITRQPVDGFWANVWRKVPFCTSYTLSRSTEDAIFSLRDANNESHWKDERWLKLLNEARGELDAKKRTEMYGEMQKMLVDNCPLIVPIWMNNVSASAKNVRASEQNSVAIELDAWRLSERWSFT